LAAFPLPLLLGGRLSFIVCQLSLSINAEMKLPNKICLKKSRDTNIEFASFYAADGLVQHMPEIAININGCIYIWQTVKKIIKQFCILLI